MKPWTETLDALDFGNDCIQPNMDTLKYFGDEDCLTLNVYVPAGSIGAQSDKQLPVVIYVVGGKFFGGTPRFYGPDFLIDQDVIVVSMKKVSVSFFCLIKITVLGDNELSRGSVGFYVTEFTKIFRQHGIERPIARNEMGCGKYW